MDDVKYLKGSAAVGPLIRRERKKNAKAETDRVKLAEKKKRRLEKALAASAAIRSELEKKKQKKKEEQQRLDEEGAAIAEAVALHVLMDDKSEDACNMDDNEEVIVRGNANSSVDFLSAEGAASFIMNEWDTVFPDERRTTYSICRGWGYDPFMTGCGQSGRKLLDSVPYIPPDNILFTSKHLYGVGASDNGTWNATSTDGVFIASNAVASLRITEDARSGSLGQMKIVNRAPLVLDPSNRNVFSYDDILKMTNNLGKKIGQGGSGSVYHGRLTSGLEVAVKVLKETGAKEFVTEVQLLLTVHHKCIARFVGYCDEGQNLILVYEYMKGGNLRQLLSAQGSKSRILTWEKRLQMAKDVATGLDYLHSQCDPSIIHRDVKTTNILLNEKLKAKIADFGLSKSGFDEDATYVSTVVTGTPGYLDPGYYATNKLTKKSDVYSFGVVLFKLISGHSPIMTTPQGRRCSLVQWIKPLIERGDLEGVADPNLAGQYNSDSLWKVAGTAAACAAESSEARPTMADVVSQLKEASVIKVKRERKVGDDQLSAPSATRQLLAGSSIPAVDETVAGSTSSAERSGTYNQYLAPPLAR